MGLSGEVASLYVRLRPNLSGFGSEASAGIKSQLKGVQSAVAETATANVAEARRQITENRELAASYTSIGQHAVRGSDEARAAATLAGEATARANSLVGASAAKSEEKVHLLSGSLAKVGGLFGLAFGAKEAIGFVKEVSGAAAAVQKSVEVIKQSFGPDSADVLVKFGDTTAAALGISAQTADATSAKFGILFKNLGIGQPQAAEMTVRLEKLAGSISAIQGIDPSIALGKLNLAMLGNVRSLKSLGLAIDPTQEKIAAFKLGLTSSITQGLTPAIRAQAIYALATKNLGYFQAEAAKHAGDYANVQRKLSAEWSNSKDIIGTALLPIFDKYVSQLADWLGKANKSGQLQRDVNKALQEGAQAFGAIKSVVVALTPPVEAIIRLFGGFKNTIEILAGVAIGSKLLGALGTLDGKLGLAGKAAEESGGKVGLMSKSLSGTGPLGLAGAAFIGGIAVSKLIEMIPGWNKAFEGFGSTVYSVSQRLGLIGKNVSVTADFTKTFTDPAVQAKLAAAYKEASKIPDIGGSRDKVVQKLVGPGYTFEDASVFANLKTIQKTRLDAGVKTAVGTITTALDKGRKDINDYLKKWSKPAAAADTGAGAVVDPGDALANRIFNNSVKQSIANAKQRLADAISGGNEQIKAAQQSLNAVITSTQQRVADDLTGAYDRQAAITKAGNAKVAADIATGRQKVAAAAIAATTNLNTLGAKLATTVGKVFAAGITPKTLLGSGVGEEYEALKAQLLSGQGGPELQARLQRLSASLNSKAAGAGSVDTQKAAVTKNVANLTDEFNKGLITTKQFQTRLVDYFKSQGVTYKTVGKTLGKGFADSFEAQVKTVLEQAGIIAKEPGKVRRTARAAGDAGLGGKVVDPNKIGQAAATKAAKDRQSELDKAATERKRDAAKLAKDVKEENDRVTKARQRLTRVEATAGAREDKARHAEAVTIAKENLRSQQHQLAEAKKASKAAAKAAKLAAKTAANTAAVASTQINRTGFPSSSTKNPGRTAVNARDSATRGIPN